MAGKQAKHARKRVGEEGARSIVLETFERYQIRNDAEVNSVVEDFASKHAGGSREAVEQAAKELARNTVVSQVKMEVAENMSMRRSRGMRPIVKIMPTSAEERDKYAMLLKGKRPMRLEEIKIKGEVAPETLIAKKEGKKEEEKVKMPKKKATVATEIASLKKKAELQKKSADEKRADLKEARLAALEEKKAKREAVEEKRVAAREARKEKDSALRTARVARQDELKATRAATKAKKMAERAEAKAEMLEKLTEKKERVAEANEARQEAKKARVAALTAEREAGAAEKRAKREEALAERKTAAEAKEKERLAKFEVNEKEEKKKPLDERTRRLIASMGQNQEVPEAKVRSLRFPTEKKKKKEEPLTGRAVVLRNNRELEGLVPSLEGRAASVGAWGKAVNSPTRTEEEREDARKRLVKFTKDYTRARELLGQVDFNVRNSARKSLEEMRSANIDARKNI